MAGSIDDIFGDGSDTDDITTSEWDRLRQSRVKDGYRAGFESGQESTLQAGFNKGYSEGVHVAYQINYLKGLLSALKAYHEQTEHHMFSAADRDTISAMLQELETLEQSQNSILLEQSQNAQLQEESQHSTSQTTTLQSTDSSRTSQYDSKEESKVSQVSRDFEHMHITGQDESGAVTMATGGIGVGNVGSQDSAIHQRLAELSRTCFISEKDSKIEEELEAKAVNTVQEQVKKHMVPHYNGALLGLPG